MSPVVAIDNVRHDRRPSGLWLPEGARQRIAMPALGRFPALGGSPWVDLFTRIMSTRPGNLIGYWPLSEQSGTTITNYGTGGAARNGVYTGVTLGQQGVGDGRTSPYYDGTNDYGNIYSTSLRDAFNGAEGTMLAWAKVANAGVWTDTVVRRIARIAADINNGIQIYKDGSGTLIWQHVGGGTAVTRTKASVTATGWVAMGLTWSKSANQVIAYYNRIQEGAVLTGVGTWAGSLDASTTLIGAVNTSPSSIWLGNIAHPALWDCALTPAEIAAVSRV